MADKASVLRKGDYHDVAEWGDKPTAGYTRPFKVAGETIDIDSLPAFGDEGRPEAPVDGGARKAPLRPAGSL